MKYSSSAKKASHKTKPISLAREGIRKGLEAGSKKAYEAVIDQLPTGTGEKEALKAVLKDKSGAGR